MEAILMQLNGKLIGPCGELDIMEHGIFTDKKIILSAIHTILLWKQ
jgi:hypothetical protein